MQSLRREKQPFQFNWQCAEQPLLEVQLGWLGSGEGTDMAKKTKREATLQVHVACVLRKHSSFTLKLCKVQSGICKFSMFLVVILGTTSC